MAILRRFIFLFLPVYLFAQPDSGSVEIEYDVLQAVDLDKKPISLNHSVTLASRLAQDIDDIPFTAYIITKEQIHNRGYVTLVDVLKDLPGIKVSQPGSAVHGETFLMRGLFGNYYVKILVDDLPMQPSATSGMPIGAQLPVAQAERIEVLYGPAAAIYGADAMAGVINIVTRKADQLQLMQADINVGLPGNLNFDATIGGKFGKNNHVWNYMIYGGMNQFSNLPITSKKYENVYNPQNYAQSGDTSYVNNPYYKGSKTQPAFSFLPQQSQKFGFRMGTNKLSFGIDFGRRNTHSAIGSNPLYSAYHDPNSQFGEQTFRVFGSYKTNIGKWYSQTNLQLLTYNLNPASYYITVDNPTSFQGQYYQYGASADVYLEQFLSKKFGNYWTVLTGVTAQFSGNLPQFNFYTTPFKPSDYSFFSTKAPANYAVLDLLGLGPYNFLNLGAIIDANYTRKKWSFLAGLRVDYREFYGIAFNPRAGVVLKPNAKNRFRFTSATAYRPPSSYLVNNGVLSYTVAGLKFGFPSANKNLDAEHLLSFDMGWAHIFSENHALDFSAYFHINKNLITRTTTFREINGQMQEYYGYVNDANSSSQLLGFQLVDKLDFKLGNVRFWSDASLQIAQGNEVLPFDRGSLNHYRMQPATTVKWLLEAKPLANFYASMRMQYFSDWRTRSVVIEALEDILVAPSYFTLDVQLRYTFSEGKEVYIMANNLTNTAFYGIGASGGAGILNGRVVFEDLMYNPQLLRVLKFGVKISIL